MIRGLELPGYNIRNEVCKRHGQSFWYIMEKHIPATASRQSPPPLSLSKAATNLCPYAMLCRECNDCLKLTF